jgi:hypothetical protein
MVFTQCTHILYMAGTVIKHVPFRVCASIKKRCLDIVDTNGEMNRRRSLAEEEMNEGAKSIAFRCLLDRITWIALIARACLTLVHKCKVAYILVPCCNSNNLIGRA